jgi:glucose-1-phosphate thymidylyltransferase
MTVTDRDQNQNAFEDLVGLLPAGGAASRVNPLPCSKELFPVGFYSAKKRKNVPPKVISYYLLEKMRRADVKKAYFILRQGKWDIPAYFGDGKMLDMHIGYLIMDLPFGVPFTLDQAYPFLQNSKIVFGFPDIIFEPEDAFSELLSKQEQTNADIVLGLFEARKPQKMDMVELDNQGNICKIDIKPTSTQLRYTWIIAVWAGRFTEFMHHFVLEHKHRYTTKTDGMPEKKEVFVGDVIHAAIDSDINIEHVIFEKSKYIDIGTPEDLAKAVHRGIGLPEGIK